MDAKAMEEMLKLLIQGMDTLITAIELALLQYQTRAEEESFIQPERGDVDE